MQELVKSVIANYEARHGKYQGGSSLPILDSARAVLQSLHGKKPTEHEVRELATAAWEAMRDARDPDWMGSGERIVRKTEPLR
jgi:hypothetical protein